MTSLLVGVVCVLEETDLPSEHCVGYEKEGGGRERERAEEGLRERKRERPGLLG